MATLALSTVGSSIGGPIGGFIGAQIGGLIDNQLFGAGDVHSEGARLADLAVQSSAYGVAIPQIYGSARVAGNIIWSRPIKEIATTTTTTSGGKGGPSSSQTRYSYYATLAIAIAAGEVDDVVRVWADSLLIDPTEYGSSYQFHYGTEDQLPDAVIESYEGVGNTPAYRDMCYVVIEDFPLAAFGNRIPNFTFEITRKVQDSDFGESTLEDNITAMVMIPGSGEFVYDTELQSKLSGDIIGDAFAENELRERINEHSHVAQPDAVVALDQLQATCPNLEWIGLVVTWFGTDLDAGLCTIVPGVEFNEGAITQPDSWAVAGATRESAYLISQDENGNPVYGGTPSDASVLRYIAEIKSRGLKVMLYPMFFMDVANKPWRGRVTGSVSDVSNFFTKTDGYNAFINHYANLVGDEVDAFVIGSELIGLTSVRDVDNSFPAVDGLVSLAASVKAAVGASVTVTYAADWSEYHHTDDGWYNLDPLWASPNIDVIGIDAYFPLTDSPDVGYDRTVIAQGWTSGEGYEFVYDAARENTVIIDDEYAWKNIAWWWENSHTNPDAAVTAWIPSSKPIWFTEFGFPSVDGASNQPNVFYDPKSVESYFPRFSHGTIDNRAQRVGIAATLEAWHDSNMVQEQFLWTWDARPYPYWPDRRDVWTDGELWETGHWVQGKLGLSHLSAIVADLCEKASLAENEYDTSLLTDMVDGFIVPRQQTIRKIIEQLQSAYFFDAVEDDGVIRFIPRGQASSVTIDEQAMLPAQQGQKTQLVDIVRRQEIDLPQHVQVNYISKAFSYQTGSQRAQFVTAQSQQQALVSLPIVMQDGMARRIADVYLYHAWAGRMQYKFALPLSYIYLQPTDVITLQLGEISHVVRITSIVFGKPSMLEIEAISEDAAVYDPSQVLIAPATTPIYRVPLGDSEVQLLDLPPISSVGADENVMHIATRGVEAGWTGAVLYRSDDGGATYNAIANVQEESPLGVAEDALGLPVDATRFDEVNEVIVQLSQGELTSVSRNAVLSGANIALLGDELIQFEDAELIGARRYRLRGLLRGRQGTSWAMESHVIGERFVLLDARLAKMQMSEALLYLPRNYKAVTVGQSPDDVDGFTVMYQAIAQKPFAPVHVHATRNGGGDVALDWTRCGRIANTWRDNVDVPLSESAEQYEIDILDGETVVRTIVASTSECNYSALEQITDFGSVQASITVRVYQLSDVVGRGYPALSII